MNAIMTRRRRKVFAVLPTLLTLGNAACGFGAITCAALWFETDATTSLFHASCLIYLAMIFDALDGRAARWAKQTSQFGAELDSLCDAISFGAAPAFLMLQFTFSREYSHRILWFIAVIYVLFTVLRLARFNVETDEDDSHSFFSGLPSPAAAGTVASFPIMIYGIQRLSSGNPHPFWEQFTTWIKMATVVIMPMTTFAVACLMVSRIRYVHLVNQLVRGKRNASHLFQLVIALSVVLVIPELSAPLLFGWFAFASPVKALFLRLTKRHKPAAAAASETTHVAPNAAAEIPRSGTESKGTGKGEGESPPKETKPS
ncbi:MAG: CDP-diacylglycerol--serine O-phosphatidyltransferase [Gemmataceae bacterium]